MNVVLKEPRNDALKDYVRVEGAKLIRAQLAKYITALKEEFAQGIILPTATTPLKETAKPAVNSSPAAPAVKAQPASTEVAKQKGVETNGVGVKIPTSTLTMYEDFKCRVKDIYDCFVNVNVSQTCQRVKFSESGFLSLSTDMYTARYHRRASTNPQNILKELSKCIGSVGVLAM